MELLGQKTTKKMKGEGFRTAAYNMSAPLLGLERLWSPAMKGSNASRLGLAGPAGFERSKAHCKVPISPRETHKVMMGIRAM